MAINHNQICSSDCLVKIEFLSVSVIIHSPSVLTDLISFLLQDVWLCGQADRQCYRKRVSLVCRDGPRAASCGNCQFYQQSDAGTTVSQMRKQQITGVLKAIDMILTYFHWSVCITTFLLVQVVWLHLAVFLRKSRQGNQDRSQVCRVEQFIQCLFTQQMVKEEWFVKPKLT